MNKLNNFSSDDVSCREEEENIKRFEDEIHKEYGPAVACGLKEIHNLIESIRQERQRKGHDADTRHNSL